MISVVSLALLLVPGLASAQGKAPELKTDEQKTLYALGMYAAQPLSQFGLSKEELEFVKAGFNDAATGAKTQVNLQEYVPKLRDLAQKRASVKAEQEKAKGKEFLDKAAKEKGATKTASGLVYKDLKAGTGPSPTATDTVKVHYRGTLIDGTEFDSSYARKEPATFPLNGVIPCWTEGVQKMKVGGKAKLVCPSSIAYGDGGSPPKIAPGATLVFEVELLEIMKK